MTHSIIHLSQLEGVHRLDAEYYQPEYLHLADKVLASNAYKRWGDIVGRFISGPFGSEFNVENYDASSKCRYVRGKDVKEFFLKDDDNVYLPEKDFERLKKYALRSGDILVSVVGTPGIVAIVDDLVTPAIFSCKSTVFRTDAINPYYLIAYLNSQYGSKLLERSVRGALQTGLNIDDLKSLLIFAPPVSGQNKIAAIVLEAKQIIDDAKTFYAQAEQLLLRELGLDEPERSEPISWVVQFSDVRVAERCDAEYFQPKYGVILERVGQYDAEISTIGREFERLKNNFKPESGRTYKYVEIGDVSTSDGTADCSEYTAEELPDNAKIKFVERQLIASKVRPNRGAVAILDDYEGVLGSGAFTALKAGKRIALEVLMVYLKSQPIRESLLRYNIGTSYPVIRDEDILNLPIPIFSESKQQKIVDLVRKSHTARTRAKQLFEEAKRKVEQLIESA